MPPGSTGCSCSSTTRVAEVEQALLEHAGPYGRVLECAVAYEQGDRTTLDRLDAPPWMADATLAGVAWAQRVTTFTAESP